MPVLALMLIMSIGIFGYTRLEGWSWADAIYMVVITLSTIGFKEVHDLSWSGRLLTIGIILTGVGTAIYAAGQFIEIIMEGQIIGYRRRKKMERTIAEIKSHYIICGFGRVGHEVAGQFELEGVPYVVLDSKEETAEELAEKNIPYIIGDITSDKILLEAGIRKAKGLIASADSDAANVFVTLSARVLNPALTIIARAGNVDAGEKMKKAGANRVISPYFIAGKRMAAVALKPIAVDFLDNVLQGENEEIEMREFKVNGTSRVANLTLGEVDIRRKSGAYIAAIRKSNGKSNLQPVAESKVDHGDTLVAIGTPKQLDSLEKMIQ